MVRKDLAKFVQENQNDQRIRPPVQGNIYLLFSGNHYDSIVTLQTQDRYDSQNTQKSPQSSNRPSQIASLPTTYRTALAIYEDWGLGIQETHMTSGSFTSEHYIWILSGGKRHKKQREWA
ncbi:hypothetical protein EVAR_38092_1 [Eumeta japonica]|uniref:Uncharacterized protein n=1 Tax=Eumeta variegata TaxID=151549 RepID=A0A4C1W7I3_EUMVA|nr:hypothetical protein EVAR_38092_1 [Eumeta japonica]